MQDLWSWSASPQEFMPHGYCYLWQPETLWLNVGSDGLIAAAYYAIPFCIYYFVRRRRAELPFGGIFLMFAAFILLCGTTHLLEIWTVWRPDYRIAGLVKAATGAVSLATTVALFRVMPRAMQLRSPRQLQREVEIRTSELAALNSQLHAEISARDLAESQLRTQDRRKDEFLATLAHELRNPLAPIRHAAKLLGTENADAAQQRWGGEVIERQAKRMALLLDDLLDVSRITRGHLDLRRERVNLAALLGAALETVRPMLDEKAHTLTVTQPDELIEILADPLRLSQIISNLLTNAAKFTPPGGRIGLSVHTSEDGLVIVVTDNGIGFDSSVVPALFEMFSQADGVAKETDGGLGIGLALVKGLITLHGGTVQARSPGPGLGAEFTVTLPQAVILSRNPAPATSEAERIHHTTMGARILIADDNRDAADSMGLLLGLGGHEVIVAHSGKDALALGRQHLPDVIILDIGMPDMNGYEVARTARSEDWGRNAFMLALTGWGQADDKERARAAGFDRHLTKPVDPDFVERLLQDYLAARHP